ncbi:DUF4398 domain-containing protein [Azospirillum sp.]|uniref:DUF4398 domain-containing protein n=1 Tax=Azospirillum sp. TaxID=34012 RepID=UPI002D6E0CB0|nr:DUF4398 domain-containing protein [Azospirillum sp.]HYD66371.1 DUF4398 domain-containing protein [Azospirillum sp.]
MTRIRARRIGGGTAAALLSLGLVACASDVPPPTAQLGAASQAILNAERAGAPQFAPGELQMARNKLAAADAAMRRDDRTEARRLAEQAQMDADLAAVHAQNAAAQQAAAAVRRDQQVLSGSSTGAGPAGVGSSVAPVPLQPSGSSYSGTTYSGTAYDGRTGVPLTPGYQPLPPPPPTVSTTIVNPAGTATSTTAGSTTMAPYGALEQGTPLPTFPGPTSWDTRVLEPPPAAVAPVPPVSSGSSSSTTIIQQRGTTW